MLLQCTELAFKNHLESLKSWLENRGYPKTLADNQLKHVTETKKHLTRLIRGNGAPLHVPPPIKKCQ